MMQPGGTVAFPLMLKNLLAPKRNMNILREVYRAMVVLFIIALVVALNYELPKYIFP
jgi:hypothetical protein